IETLLFGPMNVTRAVLPAMRRQRSGLVLTVSSTAGIAGGMFCTAYAAAKFGIEGWIESLAPEIAPYGIRTMLVEPGFFRTELLSHGSTTYAASSIDDYAERTTESPPSALPAFVVNTERIGARSRLADLTPESYDSKLACSFTGAGEDRQMLSNDLRRGVMPALLLGGVFLVTSTSFAQFMPLDVSGVKVGAITAE